MAYLSHNWVAPRTGYSYILARYICSEVELRNSRPLKQVQGSSLLRRNQQASSHPVNSVNYLKTPPTFGGGIFKWLPRLDTLTFSPSTNSGSEVALRNTRYARLLRRPTSLRDDLVLIQSPPPFFSGTPKNARQGGRRRVFCGEGAKLMRMLKKPL